MKTVIMLRRNRNAAWFQESEAAALFDLFPGKDDRSHDCDQYQHAGDFKRQQVILEKLDPDLICAAVRERAESDTFAAGKRAAKRVNHDSDQPGEQRESRVFSPKV